MGKTRSVASGLKGPGMFEVPLFPSETDLADWFRDGDRTAFGDVRASRRNFEGDCNWPENMDGICFCSDAGGSKGEPDADASLIGFVERRSVAIAAWYCRTVYSVRDD